MGSASIHSCKVLASEQEQRQCRATDVCSASCKLLSSGRHNHIHVASKTFLLLHVQTLAHLSGHSCSFISKQTSITPHCLAANCFGKESDQHKPCQEGRKADPRPSLSRPAVSVGGQQGSSSHRSPVGLCCAALFAFHMAWFVCPAGCLCDMYEEAFFMLSGLIISHRQVDTEQLKVPIQGRKHNRAPFIFTRKQRYFSSTGNYP